VSGVASIKRVKSMEGREVLPEVSAELLDVDVLGAGVKKHREVGGVVRSRFARSKNG
jgi:hypothetical protein